MFSFFRPSTQSNPEKVTLLVNKFKEGYREKYDVPRKGSPFVSNISVGLHISTIGRGSIVSSSWLLSSTSHYIAGPKGDEGWDLGGPVKTSVLPPSLVPD